MLITQKVIDFATVIVSCFCSANKPTLCYTQESGNAGDKSILSHERPLLHNVVMYVDDKSVIVGFAYYPERE